MNASRLREILELLRKSEEKYKIQKILTELNGHLNSIVSAPQEPGHQNSFAETLGRLRKSMIDMVATFEPAQIDLFKEIGAHKYFASDSAGEIAQSVQDNPMSRIQFFWTWN